MEEESVHTNTSPIERIVEEPKQRPQGVRHTVFSVASNRVRLSYVNTKPKVLGDCKFGFPLMQELNSGKMIEKVFQVYPGGLASCNTSGCLVSEVDREVRGKGLAYGCTSSQHIRGSRCISACEVLMHFHHC
jgi:hypothetical protein